MKKMVITIITIGLFLGLTLPAEAGFPRKAITLIVPFSPGGESDRISRVLADIMSRESLISVVVTNRPGKGGLVGLQALYNSRPDGYTIGHIYTNEILLQQVMDPESVRLNVMKFTWLSKISSDPFVLSVSRNSKYNTLANLHSAQILTWGAETAGKLRWAVSVIAARKMKLAQKLIIGFTGRSLYAALKDNQFEILMSDMNKPSESLMILMNDIKPIVRFGQTDVSEIRRVPQAEQRGAAVVLTREQAIIAPPGMPDDRAKYIENLIQKAIKDPKYSRFIRDSQRSLSQGGADQAKIQAEYYLELFNEYKSILRNAKY